MAEAHIVRAVRLVAERLDEADRDLILKLQAIFPAGQLEEVTICLASQHLTQALRLLELVGGERLARAVLLSRVPGGARVEEGHG